MSEQISLAGFEPPHEKELAAYRDILPALRAAAASAGAAAGEVKIKHGRNFSSIWYGPILSFRMKLRKNSRYIEVPLSAKDTAQALGPLEGQKEVSGGFWRVKLGPEPVQDHADVLAAVLRNAIDRLPKEWDCCSRYLACSDAKQCVHPDPAFALGCGYRKILASGRIFYGANRNVD